MAGTTLKTGAQTYSSAIEEADNYTRWILAALRPYFGRRLLEVGLGHGGYRAFLPQTCDYVGIDLDPESVANARARHPADTYVVADITDPGLPARLAPHRIDTVLCINVLEHIEHDREAVQVLLDTLTPGGHLLLFVPAFQALYSDLDRMAGHVRRYRLRDTARLVATDGRIVRQHYFNAVGGLGWWVNKAMPHRSLDSAAVNGQIRFFDRFVIPVARLVDGIARPVFGQSMICVVQKP
jgi:SAM-dependent methyltransferase